jgi:hypothetical protein
METTGITTGDGVKVELGDGIMILVGVMIDVSIGVLIEAVPIIVNRVKWLTDAVIVCVAVAKPERRRAIGAAAFLINHFAGIG